MEELGAMIEQRRGVWGVAWELTEARVFVDWGIELNGLMCVEWSGAGQGRVPYYLYEEHCGCLMMGYDGRREGEAARERERESERKREREKERKRESESVCVFV